MTQRSSFRAYPTPQQAQHLARTFGCVRYVWNWALHLRSEAYTTHQQWIGYAEISVCSTTPQSTASN